MPRAPTGDAAAGGGAPGWAEPPVAGDGKAAAAATAAASSKPSTALPVTGSYAVRVGLPSSLPYPPSDEATRAIVSKAFAAGAPPGLPAASSSAADTAALLKGLFTYAVPKQKPGASSCGCVFVSVDCVAKRNRMLISWCGAVRS
jgi:hypothetical protein